VQRPRGWVRPLASSSQYLQKRSSHSKRGDIIRLGCRGQLDRVAPSYQILICRKVNKTVRERRALMQYKSGVQRLQLAIEVVS